jgi:pimeloyl-ACP methyl ester carboxylesterase
MTAFVLVHGMCHGGWCWARVAPLLRAAGHQVFTPTQTGLGERAHLLSAAITLETFVNDITGVLEAEELTDVVLVGHSFAGNAISGVAHRMPGQLRHLVYLDGAVPTDGVSPLQASDPVIAEARRALGAATGNVSIAASDPAVFGVPDGPDADWVRRRLTPHPFGTLASSLQLPGSPNNGLPSTYICCTEPLYAGLAWARDRARQQPGWAWRSIAAGHDCMITAPHQTAALLMEIAA